MTAGRWTRPFLLRLGGVALAALVLRVAIVLTQRSATISGDAIYYIANARSVVAGDGFRDLFSGAPTALHPPGWALVLAVPESLGIRSLLSQQLFAALLGTATVVLVALAARAIAGERVALVAAVVAAVYPNLWLYERTMLAEVLVFPVATLLVLVAHRYWSAPGVRRAAALGATTGLLTMVRSEAILFLVALVIPVVMVAHRRSASWHERARDALVAVALCGMVILPWTIYNQRRFDRVVLLSTNLGGTIRVANCPGAYQGPYLGYLDEACWNRVFSLRGDEPALDSQLREQGLRFARHNIRRVPIVVAAREGRTWGVYRPLQQARLDAEFSHSARWVHVLGNVTYLLLLPAALGGAVLLRRRGTPIFILLSFAAVVTVASAGTFGQTRFRALVETPLVILAASALEAATRRPWDGKPPG